MTMLLTKEAILAAQDLKSEEVEVPEWGGSVRVRVLTGAERESFGSALVGKDGKPDGSRYAVLLLASTVVDDENKPLFGLDEAQALGSKNGTVLRRLLGVAERINAMGAGAMETAEKN